MRFSKEIRRLFRVAKVTRFPVGLSEIRQIIRHYGWEIYSYQEAAEIIESCGLKEMTESNDSFTANVGDRTVIFYDDRISQLDFPRILAHEIGHIVLGQLDDTGDVYVKERDCDCFAEELLAYVPRQLSPVIGGAVGALVFVGILGFFFIDKFGGNDSHIEGGTFDETSIINEVIADGEVDVVYITVHDTEHHIKDCQCEVCSGE